MTPRYGKYSGEVADNADPDGLGRLRVTVPAVFPGGTPVWARPCLPYGHFLVPPKGAKVWVEFEAGDVASPLWTGVWYPRGSVPPAVPDHLVKVVHDDTTETVLVSHKSESFLSFDDKGGALLSDAKGAYLYFNADKGELTAGGVQGHMITITEAGVTVLHQDGTRVEVAGGKVKISGKDGVQLLSDKISLAGGSIGLGGQATMSAVLGEALVTLFNTHVHPTAQGPSGPPVPPMAAGPPLLSQSVKVQQ
ncbi:phage baseplate assembly protein V [Planobispora longispora]|uniref:Gp5/Type VI secretion system Vgr protein OB-fold domain-containing protein n=1 Tax=Planobispora longispora TaxID=28887 RepID=A0A8J3RS46_9ACTN|nr:phage baseplate assembly protein V [Planobispora longispora]GIH79206.1 hypothetical protein Plo01_56350 [Planobispora longispora]